MSTIFPAGTVSHLESIAETFDPPINTQTTHSQPAPVGTQQTTTSSQSDNIHKRRTTKTTNKKNAKKHKTPNDSPPVFDLADIQATNKTAVELRCLAEKHAQTGISQEVFQSVLEFHDEMETLIAIKALELGTTVSAIEEIL